MEKAPDIDTLIGSAVYSFVNALVAAGMTPTEATRAVGFAVIDGTLGRDVSRTLGIPRPTMTRWRAQLAKVMEDAQDIDEEALAVNAMNALLPSLGFRDLRMVNGGKDEG